MRGTAVHEIGRHVIAGGRLIGNRMRTVTANTSGKRRPGILERVHLRGSRDCLIVEGDREFALLQPTVQPVAPGQLPADQRVILRTIMGGIFSHTGH